MYKPLPSMPSSGGKQNLPVLEFSDVAFHWPGGNGLQNVSFCVPRGQFVLISGSSGSGKSTLLRLIVRLEEATHGTILLNGHPIAAFYPPELRTHIGFVQQTPTLVAGTVRNNLLMPFTFANRKHSTRPDDATMEYWLERFGLTTISLHDDTQELSVGQKQRLCVIRSVLPKPDVICFDEPTSALDQTSRRSVEQVAEELAAEGISILMVNHTSYHPSCPHMHLLVQDGTVTEQR
ncbi:MAG: ATP-binding cassette domain-containing protein [Desulfovibrionales bacterium]|nr:ATP-binding cassette domain-containing protein [Desulfovibrionales bacterium]